MNEEKAKKKKPRGEDAKEHKKPWAESYATVEDIKDFLGGRIYLRHNVITGRVECRLPSNYETMIGQWTVLDSSSDRFLTRTAHIRYA